MERLSRVTPATLDILEVLTNTEDDLHGFAIAQQAGRPTGSTYPILARLEHAGWLNSHWETQNPQEGLPRRRFYRLRPDGLRAARALLLERRGSNSAVNARRHHAPGVSGA